MVLNRAKNQGIDLDIVVKDAAKRIACGVKQVFPLAQQRDDCFHVIYDMNKVRRKFLFTTQTRHTIIKKEKCRKNLHISM